MDLFIHLYAIIGIVHRLGLDVTQEGKLRLHADALFISDKVISEAARREPLLPNDPMRYVQEKLPAISMRR
ncbi:MAG TPA: hypothetical protein VGR35_11815 [Tepidisphaeraceae bacterium]|nr:hypothetical protein [Tepidisphaeraceae bacterium]